jgi:hypothetical protein
LPWVVGHEVLNPALPDDDFDAAVRIAQAKFDRHRPDLADPDSLKAMLEAVEMAANTKRWP